MTLFLPPATGNCIGCDNEQRDRQQRRDGLKHLNLPSCREHSGARATPRLGPEHPARDPYEGDGKSIDAPAKDRHFLREHRFQALRSVIDCREQQAREGADSSYTALSASDGDACPGWVRAQLRSAIPRETRIAPNGAIKKPPAKRVVWADLIEPSARTEGSPTDRPHWPPVQSRPDPFARERCRTEPG